MLHRVVGEKFTEVSLSWWRQQVLVKLVNFYQTKRRNAPDDGHLQDYSTSTMRSLNVPCGTICNQNVHTRVKCRVANEMAAREIPKPCNHKADEHRLTRAINNLCFTSRFFRSHWQTWYLCKELTINASASNQQPNEYKTIWTELGLWSSGMVRRVVL
jgi:hypothetical protein